LKKEHSDWVNKCMECEVEGSRPKGRPRRTWREVVQKDCQARKLKERMPLIVDIVDGGSW